MRLAGNWRNLFLWPCSCRVCYMFEVRAPLRLLLFFIFEKKGFFSSSPLRRCPQLQPGRRRLHRTETPFDIHTTSPPFERSVQRPPPPPTPPPLASPTAAILLVREAELCAAELESASFSCFKCLFSSPPATRPLSHSVLFSSANETLQLARTKKTHEKTGVKS